MKKQKQITAKLTKSKKSIDTKFGPIPIYQTNPNHILDPRHVPIVNNDSTKSLSILLMDPQSKGYENLHAARIENSIYGTKRTGYLTPAHLVYPTALGFVSAVANYISVWDGWVFRLHDEGTNVYVDIDHSKLTNIFPDNRMHLKVGAGHTYDTFVVTKIYYNLRIHFGYITRRKVGNDYVPIILSVYIGNSLYNPINFNITELQDGSLDVLFTTPGTITLVFERMFLPDDVNDQRYNIVIKYLELFQISEPIPPLVSVGSLP